MMQRKLLVIICFLWALMFPAFTMASPSLYSQSFIQKAMLVNQFEVLASRLALEHTKNETIKDYSRQIISGNTNIKQKLEAAIKDSGMDIFVIDPDAYLDRSYQLKIDELKHGTERSFDSLYIKLLLDSHNGSLSLYRDYYQLGDDPHIKKFVAHILPTLEAHKIQADHLAEKIR